MTFAEKPEKLYLTWEYRKGVTLYSEGKTLAQLTDDYHKNPDEEIEFWFYIVSKEETIGACLRVSSGQTRLMLQNDDKILKKIETLTREPLSMLLERCSAMLAAMREEVERKLDIEEIKRLAPNAKAITPFFGIGYSVYV